MANIYRFFLDRIDVYVSKYNGQFFAIKLKSDLSDYCPIVRIRLRGDGNIRCGVNRTYHFFGAKNTKGSDSRGIGKTPFCVVV